MMFICKECGCVFDETTCGKSTESYPYGESYVEESYIVCPECGENDYEDATICDRCGEWCADSEMCEGMCEHCQEDLTNELREFFQDRTESELAFFRWLTEGIEVTDI